MESAGFFVATAGKRPRRVCLHKIKSHSKAVLCCDLVLVARLELARYCYRGILSPLCLPIPPYQRGTLVIIA